MSATGAPTDAEVEAARVKAEATRGASLLASLEFARLCDLRTAGRLAADPRHHARKRLDAMLVDIFGSGISTEFNAASVHVTPKDHTTLNLKQIAAARDAIGATDVTIDFGSEGDSFGCSGSVGYMTFTLPVSK